MAAVTTAFNWKRSGESHGRVDLGFRFAIVDENFRPSFGYVGGGSMRQVALSKQSVQLVG
jgi:hypothetical protein